MLILTRKIGESLVLGDDMRITVFGVQGRQVKLGIDVPDDMVVYRLEVYQKIKEENNQAAQISKADFMVATQLWRHPQKKK